MANSRTVAIIEVASALCTDIYSRLLVAKTGNERGLLLNYHVICARATLAVSKRRRRTGEIGRRTLAEAPASS